MATGVKTEIGCSLINVEGVTLANTDPYYNGIVVCGNKIVVIDERANKVWLHGLQDGKLLDESERLELRPCGICVINDNEIGVILSDGSILFMSLDYTHDKHFITPISTLQVQGKLDRYDGVVSFKDALVVCGVKTYRLYWYIVSRKDGHVVGTIHHVCKVKSYMSSSSMTTKDNIVYISCSVGGDSPDTGVFGYDVQNPSKYKYKYKHKELKTPGGIAIDQHGYLFVCNYGYPHPSIHRLTSKCQLVSIFTQGIQRRLNAIFWDNGHLFLTCLKSNGITRYRTQYPDPIIPSEVLNMDTRSIEMYKKALRDGKEKVYNIRVMVVGPYDVGKTTLTKRLLGKDVNICDRHSTEGIDIQIECCTVSLTTGEWIIQEKNAEQDYQLQRLAKVLTEQQSVRVNDANEDEAESLPQDERTDSNAGVTDKELVMIPPEGDITLNTHESALVAVEDKDIEVLYRRSPQLEFNPNLSSTASEQEKIPPTLVQRKLTKPDTNTMALLKMLHENAAKLKTDTGKNSPLTTWDFAGQYVFYTTHQTFLTRRAIYLLVSDASGVITDLVADGCYFDSEGIIKRKVHEVIEVWLNSIHSCTPSDESGTPPVILVGTHVDKISKKKVPAKLVESKTQTTISETVFTLPSTSTYAANSTSEQTRASKFFGSVQKRFKPRKSKGIVETTTDSSITGAHSSPNVDQPEKGKKLKFWQIKKKLDAEREKRYRHEVCERYFKAIRLHLKDKPTRFHLVNEDFAIDNTVVDSKLDDLKRKIVEVASQQPYWGEEIPASWLPLEKGLMRLKAAGIKVIPRTMLEDMSQAEDVQIATEELELFLRFQHDVGRILYFSAEVLQDKIVLDPQWMIDALKSLITAEMFVLRNAPAVTQQWDSFSKSGKLYPELIDALWTKENNPDLHDNKEHILLLMERLNIIARPRCYSEDGSEIKVEEYFLAPCMLKETTPKEVMFPKPDPEMKSNSSVLCYNFVGKFLPSPIFHRLLATCVAHWPIAQRKSENQIFCGCCIFDLDLHHRLTVLFREYIIFARVTRMSATEKTPSSKLCIEVREFINKTLTNIIGYLGQSLKFDLFVQCPQSDGYRVDCLIPVKDLQGNVDVPCHFHDDSHVIWSHDVLKFWFQEEELSDAGCDLTEERIPHLLSSETDLKDYLSNDPSEACIKRLMAEASKLSNKQTMKIILHFIVQQFTASFRERLIQVWAGEEAIGPGYAPTVLVCFYSGSCDRSLESFYGLKVIYRDYNETNGESALARSHERDKNIDLTIEDRDLVNKAITIHGESLFANHSNLEAISSGGIISSKSRGFVEETCVILYCRVKGIIPFGEMLFPKRLKVNEERSIAVDVREGYFSCHADAQNNVQENTFHHESRNLNEPVRMGCSIGRAGSCESGTSGPFVKINSDRIGFLTCAHVVLRNSELIDLHRITQCDLIGKEIVQLSDADVSPSEHQYAHRLCGRVVSAEFRGDWSSPTSAEKFGIDAAVIEITSRAPDAGVFVSIEESQLDDAGFSLDQPPKFDDGKMMAYPITQKIQRAVIKIGSETGMTRGLLRLTKGMVRYSIKEGTLSRANDNPDVLQIVMYGLMEISPASCTNNKFCTFGDSGAGVFLVDDQDNNKLTCIGLSFGNLNDGTGLAIPIDKILTALNHGDSLQIELKDFGNEAVV